MSIWFLQPTPEQLTEVSQGSLAAHLGIEFTEVGEDYMKARMPVDARTIQPAGILHGGASVTLAETLGSTAGYLCIDPSQYTCVGLEINANHIRSVREGYVIGTARPIHLGKSTQIWDIRIENAEGKPVCIARLTMAVLDVG